MFVNDQKDEVLETNETIEKTEDEKSEVSIWTSAGWTIWPSSFGSLIIGLLTTMPVPPPVPPPFPSLLHPPTDTNAINPNSITKPKQFMKVSIGLANLFNRTTSLFILNN